MTAAIGAALMASAIVVFAWAYGQYRRPNPASWTLSESATVATTLIMMSLLTFGLGFVVRALLDVNSTAMGVTDLALIAGAFALAFALVPPLTRPARAGRVEETVVQIGSGAIAAMPFPANDPTPTAPTRPVSSGGKSGKVRRAA